MGINEAGIEQLKERLRTTETRAANWLELTEKTFTFATYARNAFITAKGPAGLELKKEILLALGITPIITNKILSIETNEWFVPIKNNYPALEREYLGLEPHKMPMTIERKEALVAVRTQWLRIVEDVRTVFVRLDRYIYIPSLKKACFNRVLE